MSKVTHSFQLWSLLFKGTCSYFFLILLICLFCIALFRFIEILSHLAKVCLPWSKGEGRRWNGKKKITLRCVVWNPRDNFSVGFHTKLVIMRTCYMPGPGGGIRGTMLDGHQRESKETQQLGRHTNLKTHLHRLERAFCLLERLWHDQKETSKTLQTSNPFQGCYQQDRKWESHPRRDLEGKGLVQGRPWPWTCSLTMCTLSRRDMANSLAPHQ